jgi:hypothetical protein
MERVAIAFASVVCDVCCLQSRTINAVIELSRNSSLPSFTIYDVAKSEIDNLRFIILGRSQAAHSDSPLNKPRKGLQCTANLALLRSRILNTKALIMSSPEPKMEETAPSQHIVDTTEKPGELRLSRHPGIKLTISAFLCDLDAGVQSLLNRIGGLATEDKESTSEGSAMSIKGSSTAETEEMPDASKQEESEEKQQDPNAPGPGKFQARQVQRLAPDELCVQLASCCNRATT